MKPETQILLNKEVARTLRFPDDFIGGRVEVRSYDNRLINVGTATQVVLTEVASVEYVEFTLLAGEKEPEQRSYPLAGCRFSFSGDGGMVLAPFLDKELKFVFSK